MRSIEHVISYISQIILKSGEQLDAADDVGLSSSVVDISIVKRTARTYRKVGILTLSLNDYGQEELQIPDRSLLKWTAGKRAILEENSQTFDWLSKGWILKEMRFKRDGKTLDRVHYRMGYRLFEYKQKQMELEQIEQISQFQRYQLDARQKLAVVAFESSKREDLLTLLTIHVSASTHWKIVELAESELFPSGWSVGKRIQGLTFLLAFIMLSSRQEVFDWKEIGAHYYGEIGGSKAFDDYKEEFIRLLEKWSGQSSESLGMISLGKITPLFFAGNLKGQWSCYQAGPVHALTDLSIAQDQYSTNATTLWLVENRGILTRLSAERSFLQETSSLVICIDGHLRSSHQRFIYQLLQNSHIHQVILWSDYDQDGLLIAGEMYDVVSTYPIMVKWICHDHQVMKNWSEYKLYMEALLQEARLEQEQVLGRAEDWIRWINL